MGGTAICRSADPESGGLLFSKQDIDRPTAAKMRSRPSKMRHHVSIGAASVLKQVRQQWGFGEIAAAVHLLSKGDGDPTVPLNHTLLNHRGTEGVAENATYNFPLGLLLLSPGLLTMVFLLRGCTRLMADET